MALQESTSEDALAVEEPLLDATPHNEANLKIFTCTTAALQIFSIEAVPEIGGVCSPSFTKSASTESDTPGGLDAPPPPMRFEPPPGSTVVPRDIFTPTHDFARGLRKTQWLAGDAPGTTALPPRMYVDQKTIIREVSSVVELRKGDHCMVTLNVLRCLHPRIDYLVSLFGGSFDLCKFYHHFVVLDDVASVDANGIPRNQDGQLAAICEFTNTLPLAVEQLRVASGGQPSQLPRCIMDFLGDVAKIRRVALADYGDMPHIFRVEENLSEESRQRIVVHAIQLLENPPKYHPILRNCEHATNLVTSKREFTSPQVPFASWVFARACLSLLGMRFLHIIGADCYERHCMTYPIWAFCAYSICTIAPVVCQGALQFCLSVRFAYKSYMSSVITLDDFYHLVVKEFMRVLVVCGIAISALLLIPAAVLRRGSTGCLVSCMVVIVYWVADAVFNIFVALSIRAMLAKFGRWWLIGGSPLTLDQSRKSLQAKVCGDGMSRRANKRPKRD